MNSKNTNFANLILSATVCKLKLNFATKKLSKFKSILKTQNVNKIMPLIQISKSGNCKLAGDWRHFLKALLVSKLRGEERESVKLAKLHSSPTLTLEQLFRVSGKYGFNHQRSNYIDCRSNADTKDRMHSAFDSLFNGEAHDQTIDHIKSETR